jgi:hypothetical protein
VAAEALTNVVRYAGATSASVTVTDDERQLIVEIADDGVGGADETRGVRPARPDGPRRGSRWRPDDPEPCRRRDDDHRVPAPDMSDAAGPASGTC